MSLFGKKSTSSASSNGDSISSEDASAVLAQFIGVWQGDVSQFDVSHHPKKVGTMTKRFHPAPDGWHIISDNVFDSGSSVVENFDIIALHPRHSEITLSEFSAGRSEQVIYSIVECKNSKKSSKLVLESMGWDKEEPCEMRLIYEVSNRTLTIETQMRPTSNRGTFHMVERIELTRSRSR